MASIVIFAFAAVWKMMRHMYAQRKKRFSKTASSDNKVKSN